MIKLFTQNHNIFSWRVKVYFMNNAKYARAKMTNVHFEKVHTFTNYDLRFTICDLKIRLAALAGSHANLAALPEKEGRE